MNEAEKSRGSWWHTFPGMLTAIAGLISALGGLFVVLHQVGLLGDADKRSLSSSTAGNRISGRSEAGAAPSSPAPVSDALDNPSSIGAGPYSLDFPNGASVSFRNDEREITYSILSTQVSRQNPGTLSLRFSIRAINMGSNATAMSHDLFRLHVDGIPRAPSNLSGRMVPARSAEEDEYEFEIPEASRSLMLTVGDERYSANIPIVLKKSG